MTSPEPTAAERQRQRLAAWRRKRSLPPEAPVVVSLSLSTKRAATHRSRSTVTNPLGDSSSDDDDPAARSDAHRRRPALDWEDDTNNVRETLPLSKRGRWDNAGSDESNNNSNNNNNNSSNQDALDQFMAKLHAGALGTVPFSATGVAIDVGGSMVRPASHRNPHPLTGGVATAADIPTAPSDTDGHYQPNDWLSEASDNEDEEQEERARRALIEALKAAPTPTATGVAEPAEPVVMELAADVKSEKSRRESHLKALEEQAAQARKRAEAVPELGRLYNDQETSVMEEAERALQEAKEAPDALQVLAELNKKKELKSVDHSQVEYLPFPKNLYRVPRSLATLTHDQVISRRAKLKVRVRGQGAPVPVSSFAECGLSEKILQLLESQKITQPFPIQAQCVPCIMAGRDVIGIAKTGSGKTLAYVLPLLRHMDAQPDLGPHESGPLGLILAPARELAYQIHVVCKNMAKPLGYKSTAVYGGAGVAEQIADLKRGTHIVTATPGRLIDILTMQSGKILSLQRVTYVVMDEADRMYDMGFAPQISAILAAVRPDRQTVLFSATFPKAVESLARKSLQYPVEVMVGGRSVASDSVTQYAERVEDDEKFLRLLQVLGEQVEGTKKVIVFVDTQVRADNLFEQLLRNGYSTLSLHGGKEQEDRDSTISDFKRKDGPNVLVATGVAGRGLDVGSCTCVINFSAPNHLEAYVHQVGRTGRAGNRGVAYTFVSSTDEAKFAPNVVRAMSEAGQGDNISPELRQLSDEFQAKVEKGEARYAGSGFKGKGYTYDSTELSEAQKMARLEKRQALLEAGLLDPDEEDPYANDTNDSHLKNDSASSSTQMKKVAGIEMEIPDTLTPEILALPGMKEALLRKAGIILPTAGNEGEAATEPLLGPVRMGDNHWLREFEINEYPREARWKVTQKDTTSRLQEEFRTAVTLKGTYFGPGKEPKDDERKLYLHLEATSDRMLQDCVQEIQRLLNEETLRVSAKQGVGGGSHKYNVLA